jgi:hypothetical protein
MTRELDDDYQYYPSRSKIFFSMASAWEIIIKVNTGKLNIPGEVGTYITSRLTDNRFEVMGIELAHFLQVAKLPDLHRDPFVGVASPLGESNHYRSESSNGVAYFNDRSSNRSV